MNNRISRREFLKLSSMAAVGVSLRPALAFPSWENGGDMARVAIHSVSVYSQPWDKSQILFQRYRDEVLHIYYEITSDKGPGWNPIWYRVWGGYVFSGYLERVTYRLNPVQTTVPENGLLAEITVPWVQSMRFNRYDGWSALYRLYYQSMHWITGIDEGPDGEPWYRLTDELLRINYNVPANTMRVVHPDEFTPISADVPAEKKRIAVSLAKQTVTAYENDKEIFSARCSSGVPSHTKPGQIPTETPKGTFHIQNKMPSKHMGDGNVTADIEAYELPGVPWVSFFEPLTGVAFHGTYWHTNYGMTMSHGCVNLRPSDALWIFRWSTPTYEMTKWDARGLGTLVVVS